MTPSVESHIWYYLRDSLIQEVEEGPFDERQIVDLAKIGKLKLNTKMRSPTRTKNELIYAKDIPRLAVAINQATIEGDAQKKLAREEKAKAKQELARLKQQERADKARIAANMQAQPKQELIHPQPALPPNLQAPYQSHFQQPYQSHFHQPQQPPPQHAGGSTVVVVNNTSQSNTVPLLLNMFLLPGLGQMVQGRVFTGLFVIFMWFAAIASIFLLVGFLFVPIVYVIALLDVLFYRPKQTGITVIKS